MSAWKSVSCGAVLLTLVGAAAPACTNGSGGTGAPTPAGIGYEKPNSPYEPSGGQEQPSNGYQPPGGSPGGSSGGGGGGGCSYCGQTYTCTDTSGTFSGSTQVTLPAADGDSCTIADDGGVATFSCDGTISFDGISANWTATGSGGFTYTVSSTDTVNGTTTTESVTITCVPGEQPAPPVGGDEDAG